MIELETGKYAQVLPLLDLMEINTLFARAVLEHTITGKVYTDNPDDPRAYYIAHPYRMSLVLGDTGNDAFVSAVSEYITNTRGNRHTAEWLQADPAGNWTGIIDAAAALHNSTLGLGEGFTAENCSRAVQCNTRVNFILDRTAFAAAQKAAGRQPAHIVCLDGEHFTALEQGVVPRFFWRDAAHFTEEGAGFVVLTAEGDVAAAAFSSCRAGGQLEIGIETLQAHRGKGYAFAVSLALIEYCLVHSLEPVWACRLENTGSYRLAQKLGFRPVLTLPYYGLAYEA